MGLLDGLNMNDPQTLGLFGAAAQMLQASGPSLMPHSFGQVMGAGLQGYNQGQQTAQAQQQAQQMQAIRDLQIKGLKGELSDQDLARQNAAKLRDFYQKYQNGGQSNSAATPMPSPMSASDALSAAIGQPNSAQPTNNSAAGVIKAAIGASAAPSFGDVSGLTQPYSDMSKFPMTQPSAPSVAPVQDNPTVAGTSTGIDSAYQQRMALANSLRKNGFIPEASAMEAEALKFRPKFDTKPQVVMGADGKPMLVQTADDGTVRALPGGYGAAEKLEFRDNGGTTVGFDPYTGKQISSITKTQSPDALARLNFDKSQATDNQDAVMDPLAVRMTAQQYLAGDASALQNFGRGAQGAQNLNAVRLEIARQANAMGLNGADIAAKMAEFAGTKAGQRTAGTRSANIEIAASEVQQLAPMALDASRNVTRSGFLPFGKAQIMFDSNTNNPALRQFAMANTALVNAYGQAMARGGSATVSDKDHARELLSTAFDQKSYEAAVSQLQKEVTAAQAAPKTVRANLSRDVSGRSESAPATPAVNVSAIPQGAIGKLKLNPKLRDAFDEKYGAGSAAAVLGN